MEPLRLPIYQGFFPQLALRVDELLAHRRMGKERVSELVRIVEDADCVYNWSDVKLTQTTTVKCQRAQFLDVRPDSKATQASMFVRASVHLVDVQAEEVLGVLAQSKTRDVRKTLAFLYGERFLDAQTLLTFPTSAASKKPAYSYRAIKWCAFKGSRQQQQHSNNNTALDFCYLEYAGRKKAQPGSTVLGFIVQESLSSEHEVPHLDSYGITRGRLSRTGIIVSRTHQSNILKVTSICQIDGSLPSSVRSAMEELMLENVAAITRVKGLLERQRMGKLQYLEEWEWVANADRKACAVCLRGFYFHRKHHCQTCGEVVCSSCAPLRELDEPLFDATQIRVCTVCLASVGGSQAASTERTSSNGGTEAYIRDLQSHPKPSRANAANSPAVGGPYMRHTTRPLRHSDESSRPRSSDLSDKAAVEYRPRRSSVSNGRQTPASASATTEALSKLAYHMQQIRETINVAMSEAVDPSSNQAYDDVDDKILQIRETLDLSGSDFDAVLASIGGGNGSEHHSNSNSERDHRESSSLCYSDELSGSSLFSQSSLGDSTNSSASMSRGSRYKAPAVGGRRTFDRKDSRVSDQTAASSGSKQSSHGKQPYEHHSLHHRLSEPEQLVTVSKRRGIHRLAHKIEKLQLRLEDSHHRAFASSSSPSVVSASDLESESEPDLHSSAQPKPHNRGRRSSYVESLKPTSATSDKARITAEMVLALRGVMESSELTRPPTAWRRSFSNSHDASSTSSRSRPHGGGAPLPLAARLSSSSSVASSSGPSKFQPRPGTTFFVYDQENENKLQRLSVSLPHEPQTSPEEEGEECHEDDEFSISSSEDALSMASGRDKNHNTGLLYPHPPSSSGSLDSSVGDSLLDEAEDVASLPDLYATKQRESEDDMRRLMEDMSNLPVARMRTSSGQSSGAPSQENHHDF